MKVHRVWAAIGLRSTQQLLLSARQLAIEFDVSVRTIWRLDAAGKLPRAIRFGRSVRWRRDEIEGWIEAGCPSRRDWESIYANGKGVAQ